MRSDPGVVLSLAALSDISLWCLVSVHCPLYKARPVFPLQQMCMVFPLLFPSGLSPSINQKTEAADRRKLIKKKVQNMPWNWIIEIDLSGRSWIYEKPLYVDHCTFWHSATQAETIGSWQRYHFIRKDTATGVSNSHCQSHGNPLQRWHWVGLPGCRGDESLITFLSTWLWPHIKSAVMSRLSLSRQIGHRTPSAGVVSLCQCGLRKWFTCQACLLEKTWPEGGLQHGRFFGSQRAKIAEWIKVMCPS